MASLLSFWTPGAMEIIVLLVVGLILFGGNLPEVGKSVGRSLVEFRRGLKDLKSSAGLDEVSKVKDEMMNMARDADPRRMLDDADDEHLPDDPYKDAWQEGEYLEVEDSKHGADEEGVWDPNSESETEDHGSHDPDDRGDEKRDPTSEPSGDPAAPAEQEGSTDEGDDEPEGRGRLEGSNREPHEEEEPPTFGYRHS